MQIKIEVPSEDGLSIVEYIFYFNDRWQLTLDTYTLWEKASKRHKFKIKESWSRLFKRHCTIERPVIPAKIIFEVAAEMLNKTRLVDIDVDGETFNIFGRGGRW